MKRSLMFSLPSMLAILGMVVLGQFGDYREIEWSTFESLMEEGKVESVVIERSNGRISGKLISPSQISGDNDEQATFQNFTTTVIVTDTLITALTDNGSINVSFRNPPQWQAFAFSILPIIILILYIVIPLVLLWFIVRWWRKRSRSAP